MLHFLIYHRRATDRAELCQTKVSRTPCVRQVVYLPSLLRILMPVRGLLALCVG